jgi:hypothetical protein
MCGSKRQWENSYRLECLSMFRQRAVVSNHRNVESEFKSYRTRVAETPSGHNRDSNATVPRRVQCLAIPFGDRAA